MLIRGAFTPYICLKNFFDANQTSLNGFHANSLRQSLHHNRHNVKPHFTSSKTEAEAKNFFDVCRLFFDLFCLLFNMFRFRFRFRLV